MKLSHLRQEVKVGLFVTLGLIAFCVSVVLFGGNSLFFAPTYHLRVQIKDVQGLGPGSIVSLAGLRIGNVSQLQYNSEINQPELTLTIEKRYQPRITTASTASLKTQGALGDRYVYIEPHPGTGEVLHDKDILKTFEAPDLLEIISARGAEFANVLEIIKEVRTLVHSFNDNDRTGQMMQNMMTASAGLNMAIKDFRALENDPALRESIVHLSSVLKKIDRGDGTLGALINDPSLHDRLMSMLGENPRNKYMKSLLRQSIQTEDSQKK